MTWTMTPYPPVTERETIGIGQPMRSKTRFHRLKQSHRSADRWLCFMAHPNISDGLYFLCHPPIHTARAGMSRRTMLSPTKDRRKKCPAALSFGKAEVPCHVPMTSLSFINNTARAAERLTHSLNRCLCALRQDIPPPQRLPEPAARPQPLCVHKARCSPMWRRTD